LLYRLIKAKAFGDLLIRWVAHHKPAPEDHHRYFTGCDTESVEQVLHIRVLL
jgi:hypothetical protein